jgi:uncharacterized OsmC-like protein
VEVVAHWEGGYRCRVPVRQFEVRADEAPQFGGDDTGPMPTELFLASLAACFAMAVAHAAVKRRIQLGELSVAVRGTYDGPRFSRLDVEVRCDHPREELEMLVTRARSFCYVSNTLRGGPEVVYSVV